jgi:hypothetical protein
MKTKTINLYSYDELSEKAQEKALGEWNEGNDYPLMQSDMINRLKEVLEERGIKYDEDSIDVRYSLSHSQGDGFMFEGVLEWGKYTIYIKHDGNPHYYHSHTANIEIQETDNLGFHVENEKDEKAFEDIYQSICKEMEDIAYGEIEYQMSEELFQQTCEANEYTFREDGTMENFNLKNI